MKGTIQIEVKMKTENNFNEDKKEDNKKRIKIFLSAFIFVLCLTLITTIALVHTLNYQLFIFFFCVCKRTE